MVATTFMGGPVKGTQTNDNAPTGYLGEYDEEILAAASATSLTTATAKTIVSVSLAPGDYDIDVWVRFIPAATTSITGYIAAVSETDNTLPGSDIGARGQLFLAANVPGNNASVICTPPVRKSLAVTTTIYAVGLAVFT